ncbi:MAG: FtsX-like permease family protein, partial [Pseudomonadota bacterium]
TIFIVVAVFLSNMVLGRLITTERTEIGLLKAFGYSNTEIALHYVKFVMTIGILGVALGCAIGYLFGYYNTTMYADMFRFPLLIFKLDSQTFFIALLIGLLAALLGALGAVKRVINLAPAEAMLPPSPPVYRKGSLLQNAFLKKLDQPTRIAIRQILRYPLRGLTTAVGVGFAVALVMMNMQWEDALDHMARVYFTEAQRQDIVLGMAEPREMSAINDVYHLPGVMIAEPMSFISVEFNNASHTHRGALTAITSNNQLQPVYDDASAQTIALPDEGIVLSKSLAEKLHVSAGDNVNVQVLEGRRPMLDMQVVSIIDTFIGMPAYVNINSMSRALVQVPQFHMANLRIDHQYQDQLFAELKETPNTGAITIKDNAFKSFQETLVEHLLVMVSMFVMLAVILGIGVTYNSARIALSERARELATLRVLGFTRGEISYVLLAELMLLIFVGLLIGLGLGYGLVWTMIQGFDTELFRIPFVLEHSTYGIAVLLIFIATLFSAFLVRRRLDHLDLIRVLKTRE